MSPRDEYRSGTVDSPIGDITVVMADDAVVAVRVGDPAIAHEQLAREHAVVAADDDAVSALVGPQLDDYFAGALQEFDLPLDWRFVTGFAREALQTVCEIPYGETAGYGEIAARAGRPRAARAVGSACRRTPFSVIVPVHRVVRSDGSIGDYGGSEHIKAFLLDLERGPSFGA